jgi:hypothetical protein
MDISIDVVTFPKKGTVGTKLMLKKNQFLLHITKNEETSF